MKTNKSDRAVIFVRTDDETKEDFLKAVEKLCMTQNTLAELLIKQGLKKIFLDNKN